METASTADDGTATGRDSPDGADRGGLVRSALWRRWRPLTAGTLLATTHQASEAMVPVVIGVVIDRGVRTGDANAMALWVAVLVGLFVVLATAGLFGYYLLERAGLLITHDVRLVVVDRVLDPRGGVAGRSGEVMSLASADADSVGEVSFAVGLTVAAYPAMVA
jgi:putative ABC transport system ATP-binding protein